MLNKKDFIKVTEILRQERINNEQSGLNESIVYYSNKSLYALIIEFIKWFKSKNSNFNEEKFKEAILK